MSPAFRYVLIASGVLKLALALTFADLTPRYDEIEFERFGRAILEEGAPPKLWRAPAHQWLVAAGLWVGKGGLLGIRILQVLLSLSASLVAYRLGRAAWGERAALVAGTFLAFYPSHVAFSHLLWSEVLYGFLALLAFERLLAADRTGSPGVAVAAGLAFGGACLTRSVGLALLGTSVGWLVLRGVGERGWRRSLVSGAAVAAAAAVVVIPWAIRATSLAGRPVIVDVNSGFNLWSGNNRYVPPDAQGVWAVGLPLANGLSPEFDRTVVERAWRPEVRQRMRADGVRDVHGPGGDDWYRAEALRYMRDDPAGVMRRAPRKLAAFWAPDFFLPRHLVRDWYGETPPALAALLVGLTWLAACVPLLAGPGALAALRGGRFRSLALLWLGVYVLVHALAYGHSRMHQPLVPLLTLAVSGLLFDATEPPPWRRIARRAPPWIAVALAAWLLGWPMFGGVYLAPGPRHAGVARAVAAGRHLPLPGAERLTWMLAGVEASRGEAERALRALEQSRHADEPWSLYLRASLSEDRREAADLVERALRLAPDLEPARRLARRLPPPTRQSVP